MISYENIKMSRTAAGITMIEIAIVMLIIAGLLGAVLGYREVIRLSYLKKVAAEAQNFGTMARAFEEKYDYLPGDFPDASENIPNCQVNAANNPANPNFCRNGNGDNRIGRYCHFTWAECYQTGVMIPPAVYNEAIETSLFWKHLFLAGMLGSVIDPRANPDTPIWKLSHPGAAIEGTGYLVGGRDFMGNHVVINLMPTPLTNPQPITADMNTAGTTGNRSMSVRDAIWMDNKYDNGGPGSGTMWWDPIGPAGGSLEGCRRSDGGPQNTWETNQGMADDSMDRRNCNMSWSVY